MAEINVVWQDRKRTLFGLPWSFTKYSLTEEKLLVETGFLNKKEEEIRLYRIMDVTLKRSFGERIFGLGTIHCCSADRSTPEFDILRIKKMCIRDRRSFYGGYGQDFISRKNSDSANG